MLASCIVNRFPYTRFLQVLLAILLLAWLQGCAQPRLQQAGAVSQAPELNDTAAVMADGYQLPVTVWQSRHEPSAVLLALHGFNDYRNAFRDPAAYFSRHGIITVAYDQRGFGATEQRGIWPGQQALVRDAGEVAKLLCAKYPGLPLYLLGESMGGAVLIEIMNGARPHCIAGTILVAPAVWGWQTMPWWQAFALRLATTLMPATRLTAEGLDIQPSDNIEMLRALGRDPLVIKATRVDAVWGITNLMDAALAGAKEFDAQALILYGAKDDIIPANATLDMLADLPPPQSSRKVAIYDAGFHMLLRDLEAATAWQDIPAWLDDPYAGLPSGADTVDPETALAKR